MFLFSKKQMNWTEIDALTKKSDTCDIWISDEIQVEYWKDGWNIHIFYADGMSKLINSPVHPLRRTVYRNYIYPKRYDNKCIRILFCDPLYPRNTDMTFFMSTRVSDSQYSKQEMIRHFQRRSETKVMSNFHISDFKFSYNS